MVLYVSISYNRKMSESQRKGIEEREIRDDGTLKPVYNDRMFLDAVRELGRATTMDVAEEVEPQYRTVKRRLEKLHEEGRVRKELYGNSYTWSIAEDGETA